MISSLGAGRPLDHIGIAVHSIDDSRALYELVSGESCSTPETLDAQGVRVAFVGEIELLEPLGSDTTIARFLARHGQGLHHVAYGTPDLQGDLERLAESGVQLIDAVPRAGARGHRVAFLHPRSADGVLVELVERV